MSVRCARRCTLLIEHVPQQSQENEHSDCEYPALRSPCFLNTSVGNLFVVCLRQTHSAIIGNGLNECSAVRLG